MASRPVVGFIGTGKMATALASGWLNAGLVDPDQSLGSDPSSQSREAFSEASGLPAHEDNKTIWSSSSIVILAVKPHIVELVLTSAPVRDDHLVISIAAGVSLNDMEKMSGGIGRFIRVMPNTPAMVGCGAAGFSLGKKAQKEDAEITARLLQTIGVAYEVPEPLLDAVTGVSGSGPAFVYQAIEAMSDGGVAAGLPRDIATTLAAQTFAGAAQMILQTKMHPGELKDMVTSPGGTTIAGIHELEKAGVRAGFMNAVLAAKNKSKELGGRK